MKKKLYCNTLQINIFIYLQIFLLLIMFSTQIERYDLPLNANFSVIQDLSRIIVYPEETIKLPLEEYFRGSLISYTALSGVYNKSSTFDSTMVYVTDPYTIVHEE